MCGNCTDKEWGVFGRRERKGKDHSGESGGIVSMAWAHLVNENNLFCNPTRSQAKTVSNNCRTGGWMSLHCHELERRGVGIFVTCLDEKFSIIDVKCGVMFLHVPPFMQTLMRSESRFLPLKSFKNWKVSCSTLPVVQFSAFLCNKSSINYSQHFNNNLQ